MNSQNYGAGPSTGGMLAGLILHREAMEPDGDPFAGTYERCASTTALLNAASALDPAPSSGRAIFNQLDTPPVRALVDVWLDQVAAGVVSLIHIFNIPCVILGGGVMEQPYAVQGVWKRVNKLLIPGFRGIRIMGALLGNMAGLYGAVQQV